MKDEFSESAERELLDFLVTQTIEMTLEQYELKKEPEDGSLESVLGAYTKEKLIRLGHENGFDVKRGWKKDKIVHFILEGILSTLNERFLILGKEALKLLQQFAEGLFGMDETTDQKDEFYLFVYPLAVRMGLLYPWRESETDIVTSFPAELKELLDDFLVNAEEVEKQYQSQMLRWEKLEEVLYAAINLYGVVTIRILLDFWELLYSDSKDSASRIDQMDAFFSVSKNILSLLIIKNRYYFIDQYLIAGAQFEDAEEVEDFYYYRLNKMEGDFYEPTKKEVQYYAKHSFDRRTSSYKQMKKLLSKITQDHEFVMSFIEENILRGGQFSDIMAELGEELLEFADERQVQKFAELYMRLNNSARLWENGGYTPEELANRSGEIDLAALEDFSLLDFESDAYEQQNVIPMVSYDSNPEKDRQENQSAPNKVGRNDPCPCGSGKKYKKCCLKKDRLKELHGN